MNKKYFVLLTWGLASLTVGLAVFAWGQDIRWRISGVSNYQLFPLFGLIAFSLMWTHYMAVILKITFKVKMEMLANYFRLTGFVVLSTLLLHPGLLIWQLWRDGLGLPPQSYLKNYVAPSLGWVALLGTASLFAFLAYELRRKFEDRPWWRHVVNISELAMLAVFYHGLRLGSQLQGGWYLGVWYFYGLTLVSALGYIHYRRWYIKHQKAKEGSS